MAGVAPCAAAASGESSRALRHAAGEVGLVSLQALAARALGSAARCMLGYPSRAAWNGGRTEGGGRSARIHGNTAIDGHRAGCERNAAPRDRFLRQSPHELRLDRR